MLKHTKFGHDSEEDITHRDTVVPFVSYVNSLRSDKSDHCQGPRGPVGARRWPGARP